MRLPRDVLATNSAIASESFDNSYATRRDWTLKFSVARVVSPLDIGQLDSRHRDIQLTPTVPWRTEAKYSGVAKCFNGAECVEVEVGDGAVPCFRNAEKDEVVAGRDMN
jgi:hypothetical protein